jgi:predicted AAA+ superfamily ATPase
MKYFRFENAVHFGGLKKRRKENGEEKKNLYTNIKPKLQQKAEIRRIFSSRIFEYKKTTQKRNSNALQQHNRSLCISDFFLQNQSYKNHNGIYQTYTPANG